MKAVFKSLRENIGLYFLILCVVAIIVLLSICVTEAVYHSFLYALVYVLENVKILFLLCSLLVILISALLIMLIIARYGKAFRSIILTRFISIMDILLIISILCYVYIHALIPQLQNTGLDIRATNKIPIQFIGDILMVFVGNLGVLGLICYLVYLFFKQFAFLIYTPKILFLRTFSFDKKNKYIEDTIKAIATQNDVLTIGNPKTIFRKTIGKTLYLPTINWKKWLDYYILKATKVILVVDNSEGVLWEMFEHINHLNKYIFIVPDKSVLMDILNDSNVSIEKYALLMKYLQDVIEKTNMKQFVFSIKKDEIKISPIEKLGEHVQSNAKIMVSSSSIIDTETRRLDKLARMREKIIYVLESIWFFLCDVQEVLVSVISGFFSKKWFYILLGLLMCAVGIFLIVIMFIAKSTIAQYLFSISLGSGVVALGIGLIVSKLKE